MDTTQGPGAIAAALGSIEDELHEQEHRHSELTGICKRKEKFFETYLAALYDQVDPTQCANPTERMKFAMADLHADKLYQEYLDELEALNKLRKKFDYLDIRRSIGQTILRRGHDQGDEPKWGQQNQPAG